MNNPNPKSRKQKEPTPNCFGFPSPFVLPISEGVSWEKNLSAGRCGALCLGTTCKTSIGYLIGGGGGGAGGIEASGAKL